MIKTSVYASIPSPGIDMVMAKHNVMEMFGEINSLLKIDYSDFNVDAIASKIISSLKHESTVAIAFAVLSGQIQIIMLHKGR